MVGKFGKLMESYTNVRLKIIGEKYMSFMHIAHGLDRVTGDLGNALVKDTMKKLFPILSRWTYVGSYRSRLPYWIVKSVMAAVETPENLGRRGFLAIGKFLQDLCRRLTPVGRQFSFEIRQFIHRLESCSLIRSSGR